VIRLQRRQFLAAAAMMVLASPARAHAILLESDPRHAANIGAGARVLVLRFNSRLDHARSRLTLVRPGKVQDVLPLAPGSDDALAANATLAPGAHVLRWQVLAIDGHITRGDVPFTVVAP